MRRRRLRRPRVKNASAISPIHFEYETFVILRTLVRHGRQRPDRNLFGVLDKAVCSNEETERFELHDK